MDRVRLYMFIVSLVFLAIVIWNILHLRGPHGYSFWLWLLSIEKAFKCSLANNASENCPLGFNLLALFTTLISCIIYFVIGVVNLQAVQAKSMTSAIYFKSTLKVCTICITFCALLTLVFGLILLIQDADQGVLGPVLYSVQLVVVLLLQLSLLLYSNFKVSKLIERLVEFHHFLTSYRQTPRSRIFKKHIPAGVMEPILEADSFLEASMLGSVVSKNKSRKASTGNRMSILSTRFVYSPEA